MFHTDPLKANHLGDSICLGKFHPIQMRLCLGPRPPRLPNPGYCRGNVREYVGWHYFVFYGITCLIRLIEFAAFLKTFEEHMC